MPGQGEDRFDLDESKVRFGAEPTQEESGTEWGELKEAT